MNTFPPVIEWHGDFLRLIDQRALPAQEIYIDCHTVADVSDAISDMVVRGAPAIGIAGAYGVVLSAQGHKPATHHWQELMQQDLEQLANARPTAVNLRWAIERMKQVDVSQSSGSIKPLDLVAALLKEAQQIQEEEKAANQAMSQIGSDLIQPGSSVITHCNTGTLATSGMGTALGVIKQAWEEGKLTHVYADETRPWLQGARLTMWEFQRSSIPAKLICEGAAASVMAIQGIDWVIVGADRITANGDVINKIGTYSLAVVAKHHGAKVMVVAPQSTIDMQLKSGKDVVIEERTAQELMEFHGQQHTPSDIAVYNPSFDVTPYELVDAIVTETGQVHFA